LSGLGSAPPTSGPLNLSEHRRTVDLGLSPALKTDPLRTAKWEALILRDYTKLKAYFDAHPEWITAADFPVLDANNPREPATVARITLSNVPVLKDGYGGNPRTVYTQHDVLENTFEGSRVGVVHLDT